MDQVTFITLIILILVLCLPIILHRITVLPVKHQQVIKYGIFILYVIANLYLTLLSRIGETIVRIDLVPFWSYRVAFWSILRGGFDIEMNPLAQNLLNILLYFPMGYLLPVVIPGLLRSRPDRLSIARIICIGLCASVATEFVQLVFHIGWFDIDDIINNTLGATVGVLLYVGTKRSVKP